MTFEWIIILVASVLATAGITIAVILYRKLKQSGYDRSNNQAVLDDVRASFEKQMYVLNERLLQNEERWKDVNHLLLRKESPEYSNDLTTPRKVSLNNFLQANGIKENDLVVDEKLIFVLTPFHTRYYDQYMLFKETCSSMGFNCQRGDEKYFDGDIFPEVLKLILKSRLIIANINGRNSNVLYELGVAQALDKKVILIAQSDNEFPVDIKSQKFILYKDSDDLKQKLRVELDKLR